MGGFFTKAAKTSKDVLEELEKQIHSKTVSRQRNQQYERSFVSYLLLLSFGLYLVGVAVLYLYFRPSSWAEWLVYLTPLILFPIVVYMIKKVLNLYFSHRKTLFDEELSTLHEEKRKVLNEVMEKETYKTAVELLERYEPTHPSLQRSSTPNAQHSRGHNMHSSRSEGRGAEAGRSEMRRRGPQHSSQQPLHPAMLHPPATPVVPPVTPAAPSTRSHLPVVATPPAAATQSHLPVAATPAAPVQQTAPQTPAQPFIPPGMCLGAPPGPPTPCPILPRDRSKVDKVVEYLVGDGPNNRYALICGVCSSHNGMALRDEFEYISFRCAYCFTLTPARKKKPSLKMASQQQPEALPLTETPLPQSEMPDAATENSPQVGEDTPQRRQTRQRRNHRNSEVKELTEKNTN